MANNDSKNKNSISDINGIASEQDQSLPNHNDERISFEHLISLLEIDDSDSLSISSADWDENLGITDSLTIGKLKRAGKNKEEFGKKRGIESDANGNANKVAKTDSALKRQPRNGGRRSGIRRGQQQDVVSSGIKMGIEVQNDGKDDAQS